MCNKSWRSIQGRYKEGTRKVQGRYKEGTRKVLGRLRGVDARDGEGKRGGRGTKYVLFINVKAVGCRGGFDSRIGRFLFVV